MRAFRTKLNEKAIEYILELDSTYNKQDVEEAMVEKLTDEIVEEMNLDTRDEIRGAIEQLVARNIDWNYINEDLNKFNANAMDWLDSKITAIWEWR